MEPMITDAMVEEFRQMDTCCLSDAMDRLGIPCGLEGIKPVNPDSALCGRAFTVHYVPCGTVKGTVGDFLDDVKPGEVVVIDNGGRTWCTVWGDLMSIAATHKGIAGTVIDGVCRDLPTVHKLNYNIFTKGHYMVTGKDRVEVDQINVPGSGIRRPGSARRPGGGRRHRRCGDPPGKSRARSGSSQRDCRQGGGDRGKRGPRRTAAGGPRQGALPQPADP